MVAAARALASREADALIGPFRPEALVGRWGSTSSRSWPGRRRLSDPENKAGAHLLIDVIAVRTRFFDDTFVSATSSGIQQAVILASVSTPAPTDLHGGGRVVFGSTNPRLSTSKPASWPTWAQIHRGAPPSARTCATTGPPFSVLERL